MSKTNISKISMLLLPYQKCAPSRVFSDGSCFEQKELICAYKTICRIKGIVAQSQSSLKQLSKSELWRIITNYIQNVETDNSWIHNKQFMETLYNICPTLAESICFLSLRPKFSGNKEKGWLSDVDIELVIAQYSAYISNFHHHGTFPCNYRELNPQLKIAPNKLFFLDPKNRKKGWSMVLNTDVPFGPGEHWVAVYQEYEKPLEYFDPAGDPIVEWMNNTLDWLYPLNKINRSTLEHQTDKYMCGVYCCFFIFCRASGIPFKEFNNTRITFEDISTFRDIIFSS